MPTYTVTNSNFNLTSKQQKNLAEGITKVHNIVTGANTYFAQVIFNKTKKNNHFMGGKKVKEPSLFLHGQIRAGRSKKIKDKLIADLKNELTTLKDSIAILSIENSSNNYFNLQGNENAVSYIEELGFEALELERQVTDYMYDQNLVSKKNYLIPYEGMNGKMKINKIKFLNHKWIIADFTDGRYWGEMILEYYVTKANKIELNQISSLLYPSF